MELGALKPIFTNFALPPTLMLLGALVGLLLAMRHKRLGLSVVAISFGALWLVSCHGTAVWLARHAVPQFEPITAAALKASKAQAIVVLGGGLLPNAPEYGAAEPRAQPNSHTAQRLRYGVWLSRQTGLPVGFAGGLGWGALGSPGGTNESEAAVAARVALQDYGVTLRWLDAQSRDTQENAQMMSNLLKKDGVQQIALVTSAWHMPRSVMAFERAGMRVLPAPTGYTLAEQNSLMEWLPSGQGLLASRWVIREWLGLLVARAAGG